MEAGATITSGGSPLDGPGTYYPPTLITNAKENSEIVKREVLGPVLTVIPFDDEHHALHVANDSYYVLASSVWANADARALRVSRQIEASVTWINDQLQIASEAPPPPRRCEGQRLRQGLKPRITTGIHRDAPHHG